VLREETGFALGGKKLLDGGGFKGNNRTVKLWYFEQAVTRRLGTWLEAGSVPPPRCAPPGWSPFTADVIDRALPNVEEPAMSDSPQTEPTTGNQAKQHFAKDHDTAQAAGITTAEKTVDYPSAGPQASAFVETLDSVGSAPAAANGDFSWTEEATTESADQPPAPAGYQILGTLGHGGMGVVYKARQTALDRLVALKMLLVGAHASPLQLTRFRTEAEAVARLQHPNIVQIYEVGLLGGLPFFSLEFVSGGTLEKKLASKPLPAREAAELLRTLAAAVHYAHVHGIIHRDLKPANILLTADGTPKITDFGLAKKLDTSDSSYTRTGTLMGTPSYMAPEQARGDTKEVGPLADTYALGAILYQLLTGRPPFQGATVVDTLEQVQQHEPVRPTSLQPKVPRDLETICLKCLQKEPAKRYADAAALADDLTRFLDDRPIRARPVGRVERLVRWCRKNPRTAALSAAVVVLVVALGGVSAVEALRASQERQAVARARELVRGRLDEAAQAIAGGNAEHAQALLGVADPQLETATALADLRQERDVLRAQVAVYEQFKKRVDAARFTTFFEVRDQASDSRGQNTKEAQMRSRQRARQLCQELLQLVNDIEGRTGLAAEGLPPLDAVHQGLWREEVFETFLMAGQVEWQLAELADDPSALKAAARQNLAWLERAEQYLPGTRILAKRRGQYRKALGEPETPEAGQGAASAATAVDHFWSGVEAWLQVQEGTAGKAEEQRQFRAALAEFTLLLRMRPDSFWGYFEWAYCQLRLGNTADALIGFTVCTHLKPDAPWPYYNRGTLHFQLKQYDLAAEDFDATVKRDPQYYQAFLNRGLCHVLQNRPQQGLEDFSRAIAAHSDYALAYYHRAETYSGLKRNREARDDYDAVLRLQPDRADCYLARGMMHLLLKDFDHALADFRQAGQRDPRNPLPPYLVGVIHLGKREYDKALPALEQSIAARLGFDRPYLARAQIRLRKGQLGEALEDADLVLTRLTPADKSPVLNDRADILVALGRIDKARADLEESIKLAPKEVNAYVGLARLYQRQNKPDEARACYDRLVAANPGLSEAYLRRAEYRRDQDQFDEALADCAEAAKHDKDSILPGLVQASVAAARGDHAAAVAEAEKLLARGPADDGHVLYAAACVWALASRTAAAQPNGQSLAKSYADRAIALLAATQDKGFHDLLFEEHNRIPDDPSLAALRPDPRFLEVLGR
jgi:tetratricopeptide (TPR) repeat protein